MCGGVPNEGGVLSLGGVLNVGGPGVGGFAALEVVPGWEQRGCLNLDSGPGWNQTSLLGCWDEAEQHRDSRPHRK